ncbi:hypothetical protein SEUCBS139899_004153 [Sporothrix eucalyptigena]|uniref:Uncharacterized protein n=1 Tax=Sporothrix eucalyptigena TaxID=1812306 RepID=A0ABP0B0W6_9PEZI
MPGRQAHGRPLLADPNKKRKGGKKSGGGNGGARLGGVPSVHRSSGGAPRTRQGGRVDVMALAEQQIGESRAKGVRVRDLEVEREQGKQRRNEDDDDEDDEDDEEEVPKRRRPNNDGDKDGDASSDEIHSDSSGNEWREGVGSDDDDSEIDSDEAFGDSDDDEIFDAFAFRGSSSKQNKNKKKSKKSKDADDFDGFDEDEGDFSSEDVGDDGADLGDEAIDLAAALDIVSSDEDEAETSSSKKDKSLKKKSRQANDSDVSASDLSMSGSDDDDSNSDSDEQSSTASSDFDSDDEDEDDEDEDDAGFSKSDALQSIASAYAAGDSDGNDDSDDDMANAANPYQFNATLGSKDRSLKKSIKAAVFTSSDKTLDVPLLPMQQDRQLRAAAAEKAHETLDRWTETVKHNRRAEHITFEVAGSLATSGLDTANLLPINQTSAQTDLEKTILSIMEESGLGPKAQEEDRAQQKKLQREQAEAQLSPDALKAIIGQKRRARELQSREQARAKRIKKIKSKAYRRVHRRERQRAEDALDDSDAEHDSDEDQDSEAEREAAHRRRAMERMGSRHRESRWAKRAKTTNRAAWDDEFRAGLVDMARQDEELRRRVDGAGVGGGKVGKAGESDDDSDSDSFDEESDEEAFKLRTKEQLAKAGGAGADEEPKGLMAIAFMQKAEQARRKANDEAVAEILRDLDRGDDSDEDMIRFDKEGDDDETADKAVGRRTYGPAANGTKPASDNTNGDSRQARQKKAAAEREEAAAASESPASKPSHAKGVSDTFPARKPSAPGDAGSWTIAGKTGTSDKKKSKKTNGDVDAAPGLTSDGRLMMTAVVDDVLAQNKAAEDRVIAKDKAREAAAAKKASAAAARASQAADESETSSSGSDSEDDADDADHRTTNRSSYFQLRAENEQLLRKALGEDDAAAEFAAEKAAQAAEEAAAWEDEQARARGHKNKNSATSMPGWGSWVGDGVSKRAMKRDQRAVAAAKGGKGGKSKAVDDKKALVRRDAKLDKVIISEKRIHKNDKYMASQLPHEYETRMQYERSLRLPVGPEWSTTFAFQDATKPRVLKKQGVVLPMAKPQM